MGIYIHMRLAGNITREEWNPVYKESLKMAAEFGFYDFGTRNIHGHDVKCLFDSEEYSRKGFFHGDVLTGWRVVGSRPENLEGEDQFTPRDIDLIENTPEDMDVLATYTSEFSDISDYEGLFNGIWGNKTQGEPYHMGLLAIGCMMEDALGNKAVVEGDITYGQCVTAAKMASEALGRKIKLPVCCRLNDLCERVNNLNSLNSKEKIKFILNKYMGDTDLETGACIRSYFSAEAIEEYWKESINDFECGTIGFNRKMKTYFLLGFELDDFCRYVNTDDDNSEKCRKLIEAILETSMHIKEKDCEDVLDYTKYSGTYSIYSLMANLVFGGGRNRAIDRYIPLDEMKEIFSSRFGNVLDVNQIVDEYVQKNDGTEENPVNEFVNSAAEKLERETEKYDINEWSELCYYTSGSTINPGMLKSLGENFRFYRNITERKEYSDDIENNPEKMFSCLAAKNRECFLFEEDWERIYTELHRDKDTFERYYPMVCVTGSDGIKHLLRAFVTNDDFWNYCCDNFSTETE